MKENILEIPLINLSFSFIPILILFFIFLKLKLDWKSLLYATMRMLVQLLSIGYFLALIFNQKNSVWTFLIVFFMLLLSSWISLYSIKEERRIYLKLSFVSLLLGAFPVLLLVTIIVIPTHSSWYNPSFFIPLAGMVFSNSLNTVGLCAERFIKETKLGVTSNEAMKASLKAALIPQMNSFFAVGLVALPGMMTGQILSGIDPLIAVRYQIVVMTMVMGSGGITASIFLSLIKKRNLQVKS